MSVSIDLSALKKRFDSANQSHVFRFWDELNSSEQTALAQQLDGVDLTQLQQLVAGQDDKPDFAAIAQRAQAPPAVKHDGSGAAWNAKEARLQGQQALSEGRVAAVIVAGGQGTRLGFDQPKGMFPIGPLSGRTLFQYFADKLTATAKRYGKTIPLYLMTSPATHDETVAYWEQNRYLGLNADDVLIFCQGTMPAVDAATGKLILQEKDSLALSPDGHGGTVAALHRAGCLTDAARRGIDLLAYIQVDNPLVQLCDPDLIGHHLMSGSQMTTQVVRKRFATEKVGNVVLVDGAIQIIEYSDLPESQANQLDAAGELKLWAGNIAVHVIDRTFLESMVNRSDALPFHRAHKAVPYIDEQGHRVTPSQPNAIKFERFIFDLLPLAENGFVVESLASEAFAPVKNASGSKTDTAEHAKQAIVELHRRWLQSSGAVVANDVQVEIHPAVALDQEQVQERFGPETKIQIDTYLCE